MATTISLPTVASTNTVNANNWFAANGVNNTNPTGSGFWASEADITLSAFSSLSIPAGATIDGIEIIIRGGANVLSGDPDMAVYNGSSTSSFANALHNFGKGAATYDPMWGANNDLWGLTWNATTAAAIKIILDSSTVDGGAGRRMFADFFKVRITYTEASGYGNAVNSVAAANIGKVDGVTTANIEKIIGV